MTCIREQESRCSHGNCFKIGSLLIVDRGILTVSRGRARRSPHSRLEKWGGGSQWILVAAEKIREEKKRNSKRKKGEKLRK